MTNPERYRAIIAADKETAGVRDKLKESIEEVAGLEVIQLSRVKISRIRGEIVKKKPDLVLVTAALRTSQEFDELRGFVRRVRRHLPESKIVIHGPNLFENEVEAVFESGADAWIDERMAQEYIGLALQSLTAGEDFVHSMMRRKGKDRNSTPPEAS